MSAHEIGAFCVVRKSNDPFNTTWCWPREQWAGQCAVLPSTAVSSSQPTAATPCVSVCFICHVSGCQQPDLHPQQTTSALLKSTSLGGIPAHPGGGLWNTERKSCLCSLSVSWLVHSDLTPDLVSKCRWSTNNSVAGLVISSSLRDAQKSFRLCPLVLKQICAKQGSPWDNSTVAATVLMYSAAIEPQSLQPHHHTKKQSHTISVPPWE